MKHKSKSDSMMWPSSRSKCSPISDPEEGVEVLAEMEFAVGGYVGCSCGGDGCSGE
ncbi:hypothetical protein FH972_012085 [Carpinus fangiana]|uniref:Uncharacterized protein n=1 Tax=Carpinus fangiana TaxID=176857 RepID=A0A5N6R2Q8_9ROSI|nr:hypothetical protein FH972_012085 [Carpinus fangiana]